MSGKPPRRNATARAVPARMLPTPSLPGTRVTLRPLALQDASAIFSIFSDPGVMRYWSRPAMTDLAQAHDMLRDIRRGYRNGQFLQLGIERNDDRLLVGTCTLFHIFASCRRAEVGFALGSAHWGRGLMGDALRTLFVFAFGELALNRIEADIDPRNGASARTLERLGFVKEGHLRERWIVGGEVSDTDLYGLLRSGWRAPAGELEGTSATGSRGQAPAPPP